MGSSEHVCQLCGIGFNIGRIRDRYEPESSAWSPSGRPGSFATFDADDEAWTGCRGCEDVERKDSHDERKEHIAGWGCMLEYEGYSAYAIEAEEMRERTWIRCLLRKDDQWVPEPGDEDFEIAAKHCFMTGISKAGVNCSGTERFQPIKHSVQDCRISNHEDDPNDPSGLPVHPACFEMFKRMSVRRFGTVDIDGLWLLCRTRGGYPRFANFDEREDVILVRERPSREQRPGEQRYREHLYRHVRGTEYLAASPIDVPDLISLIESRPERSSDVLFEPLVASASAQDPFQALSPELCAMLLEFLEPQDVAHLRLCSKAFSQLPQSYFKQLIEQDMPWMWELCDGHNGSISKRGMDWHDLWRILWILSGGWCMDEERRAAVEAGKPIYGAFKYQIMGLRNRRMIYDDISIILDMMAEARTEVTE